MAASPSKNPPFSSIPSRSSNPRNSEVSNPIRRSFSGSPVARPSIITIQRPGFNPNTPANSPSDYPRRKSLNGENIVVSLRDFEDKENRKDQILKQARVRSPASSKGTKNFMSPTISATSKINASPRKKILTERNEPTRTSVSSFDCKSPLPLKEDLDLKPEKGLNQKKEVSFDPTITYLEDKDSSKSNEDYNSMVHSSTKDDRESLSESTADDWDSLSKSMTVDKDCVNLDPSFQISPRASCPLAPLDADSLMPRYDPRTNYLSPRPQFLHYKPNPRIQLYLNKERDGEGLVENSASEISSDAEVTEGEEDLSDYSHKDSEDASSGDVLIKGEEEEEEEEEESTSKEAAEVKRISKKHFFTKIKFTTLLLILAVACLWVSVTYSPVRDPSVLNNLSLSNLYLPPEISESIRDNLQGLAQKFQQWVYDFLSYIHNHIISFRERLKPGPLQFANLTTLLDDGLFDNYLLVDHSLFGSAVKYERNELSLTREVDIKSLEEEEDQSIEVDENVKAEGDEVNENVEVEGDDKETDENIEEAAEGEKNDQEYEDDKVIALHDNLEVLVNDIVLESEEVIMTTVTAVKYERNELSLTREVDIKSLEEEEDQSIEVDENVKAEGDEVNENVEVEGDYKETDENIEEAAEGEKNDQEYEDDKVIALHDNQVLVNDIVLESEEVIMTTVTQERVETAGCIEEPPSETDVTDLPVPIPQAAEIQPDDSYPRLALAENDMGSVESESSIAENKPESFDSDAAMNLESVDLTILGTNNMFSSQAVMCISLLVWCLLAPFAFIYIKKKTSTTSNVVITMDRAPVTKKVDYSPLSVTTGHSLQEVDETTDGESCPSEMSSFQYSYSSSFSKGRNKRTSESQSQKHRKNSRRESLASSDYSTESQSYGSFTSYEKIINKNGNGEEKLLTPVRRSSRIRNHVTSP